MRRVLYLIVACIAATLGFVGVLVPVLPTTPFLLLAAFCFSRSSERLNRWLQQTRAYSVYVEPFKRSGGITAKRKASILAASYTVMGISAYCVQRWYVWVLLGAMALWLAYLMLVRIPTISRLADQTAKHDVQEELEEDRELSALFYDGEAEG